MIRVLENGELVFFKLCKCKYCGEAFEDEISSEKKYCSKICNREWLYNNKIQKNELIEKEDCKQAEIKQKPTKVKELSKAKIRKKKRQEYKYEFSLIRKEILERDNYTCVECGEKNDLNIHHIIHRKNGGKNNPENLQTLCAKCHTEKHKNESIYKIMALRTQKSAQ